jgi:hypothetical protein
VVTEQIQHEKFWGLILGLIFGQTNDIMLLKLDSPVSITTPVVWATASTAACTAHDTGAKSTACTCRPSNR